MGEGQELKLTNPRHGFVGIRQGGEAGLTGGARCDSDTWDHEKVSITLRVFAIKNMFKLETTIFYVLSTSENDDSEKLKY